MIYPANFEAKINFNKIRHLIAANCLSEMGKELVDAIAFSTDPAVIATAQEETDEAARLHREETDFPAAAYQDARPFLGRLRVEGLFLEIAELIILKNSLESLAAILRFFKGKERKYPRLAALAAAIRFFPYILQRLDSVLTKHGTIKDSASPALADIRQAITRKQAGISRRMQALLQKAQEEGWADKESALSIRDGRVVIPVPSAFKRKIGGIVHDESATGKTSYIEPTEIIETNNEIRELQGEEKREITRVLRQLATDLRPYVDDLLPSYDLLAHLDFLRGKARFALDIDALSPPFTPLPVARWHGARHPLLHLSLRGTGRPVVPLDLEIDDRRRLILISGPNAGGKSVCLQTAGLLQYMFQCGIPVPVEDDSHFGIFRHILIDIGDEQSIENDLSTYSSHLINMKNFLRHADADALVLIDEFGAGTEPMLGGAIAEAILDALNKKNVKGVITTHYTNLKHFAASADGIENGAMLYDAARMTPLFRLEIGNPGSSFAFEIARQIGLPAEIIAEAAGKIGEDRVNFDKHLKEIIRDKHYWEKKREQIHQNEKRLEETIRRYTAHLEETSALRRDILRAAKEKAADILRGATGTLEATIREIRESQAEKERTKKARQTFERETSALLAPEDEEERLRLPLQQLRAREKAARPRPPAPVRPDAPLLPGDIVRLDDNATARVLAVTPRSITIALGNLVANVKPARVTRITPRQAADDTPRPAPSPHVETITRARARFQPEIDLRGLRAEEAIDRLTAFIDDATMLGETRLRLLHGTGTGALKQAIRAHLRRHPLVADIEDEDVRLGGAGITKITLHP